MHLLDGLVFVCLAGACLGASVQYNEDEAKIYMQYARASFCTRQSLGNWDCGDMCDDTSVVRGSIRFFEDEATTVQGYVARMNGSECIVAFRGSVTTTNYIYDFRAVSEVWPEGTASWCPGCRVHTGVAKSYKAVRSAMTNAIADLKCTAVNFAGHSLGGALVGLASLEVRASLNLQVNTVYTYGMLRTGNQHFVDAYLNASKAQRVWPPMWRIVHYKDPVPRIPLVAMGYVHVPAEVYYVDIHSAHWKFCTAFTPDRPEDESCSSAIGILHCIPPFADASFNHNMYMNKSTLGPDLPPKCLKQHVPIEIVV